MSIRGKFPYWFIGTVVTLFFLFITSTGIFDFTDEIEIKTFDLRARIAAPAKRNPDIEVVAITDEDLSELGRYPWPRHILAQGIQNLAHAGAKVIALNLLFTDSEENAGFKPIGRLKEKHEIAGIAQQVPRLASQKELSKAVTDLDNDGKFYKAIEKVGKVVLPVYFDSLSSHRDLNRPDFIAKHAFKRVNVTNLEWSESSVIRFSKVKSLVPSFAEIAAGIGHINLFPDQDGYIRNQIHVLGYLNDIYFPSFPLVIVKIFKGLKDEDMTVALSEGITLRLTPSSVIKVPAKGHQMRTLINWTQGPNASFHYTPFTKVFENRIQTSLFRDKIVIVGLTAPELGDRFATPICKNLPEVEIVANSVANILNKRFLSRPPWTHLIEFAVLVFFGLFISIALPRLGAIIGAFTTIALLFSYSIIGAILFSSSQIWLRISPSLLLLILGYVLIVSTRLLIKEKSKEKVETDEEGESFKGLVERIPRLKHAEPGKIFGLSAGKKVKDNGDKLMDKDAKPTLGQYKLLGEIERDSTGTVYKGQAPQIQRTVAIKTVSLAGLDEDIVDEIKERFFREAKSASLLNHPNIVKIYEWGEESDFAYIAMEYVEGEDLRHFTKVGHLIRMRDVLDIIAQVADALDYAHSKNIIHGGIRPAAIMKNKDTNEVKVADFGLARITSFSKVKTRDVLATLSYMSPEQVSGKKEDGRSDIFSTGAVLFELLTGQKPFTGEDMTSLMFKLVKEKHPSPRDISLRIPLVVENIIDKALEKDVKKRYQRADQMAAHLKQVVVRIDKILSRKTENRGRQAE